MVPQFWKQRVISDLAWFSFLHILLNARGGYLVGLKGERVGVQRGGRLSNVGVGVSCGLDRKCPAE